MNAIEEYLSKSGQTMQYVLSGASQYGVSFIIDELVPRALAENKIITWKTRLVEGEDLGLVEWGLENADRLAGICREAIIANIIGEHPWGENKEIKSGTKHFRAGTKVYCVFMYGGMGHEQVRVFGKPRRSFRMIDVVIRRSYLRNFRVQKVYAPQVIAFLDKYPKYANTEIIRSGIDRLNENKEETG